MCLTPRWLGSLVQSRQSIHNETPDPTSIKVLFRISPMRSLVCMSVGAAIDLLGSMLQIMWLVRT